MQYPIFIHKDLNSDFGVIVPDLPGCFSAGKSIEQAIENAHEAIECHVEGLLLDGEPLPLKQPIEQHLDSPDLKGGVLALVDIDLSRISGKSRRVNITLPERFLKQIDEYSRRHGSNRSAFLADAAMCFMAEHRT
jgi:predicted RNase H-like HicB family nuclease